MFIMQPRPHPLVALVDVAGMVCAVSPRADVIPRQVMSAAHPTGSGGRGSEQTQAAEFIVQPVALQRRHFGGHSL